MYNHRKLKSALFLQKAPYPERILSRHQHYKKSGVYAFLRSRLSPVVSRSYEESEATSERKVPKSKMLLEGIPKLYYFDNSLTREDKVSGEEVMSTRVEVSKLLIKAEQKAVDTEAKIDFSNTTRASLSKNLNLSTDQRGLQKMEDSSLTNGLLESGHRYLNVS